MVYDDYLKHYGVLGMKWGISRSKEVRGAKKEYKKRMKEAKENAADRLFGDGSSARNKRIVNASLGKAILQSVLMGSYGAKKYNQYRSEGKDRGYSYVRGYFDNIENASTGGKRDYLSDQAARSIRKKKEQQSKRQ